MTMLDRIEKNQAKLIAERDAAKPPSAPLAERTKKSYSKEGFVTAGVKLPVELRERLAVLKPHMNAHSINDVIVQVLTNALPPIERNLGLAPLQRKAG